VNTARTNPETNNSPGLGRMRLCRWFLAGLAVCVFANVAVADMMTFGGLITQSTQDGAGPAVNNPGLNNIRDGDVYSVNLNFAGSGINSINSPGTYNLTGGSLTFRDRLPGRPNPVSVPSALLSLRTAFLTI
jgi:hypothetical protein